MWMVDSYVRMVGGRLVASTNELSSILMAAGTAPAPASWRRDNHPRARDIEQTSPHSSSRPGQVLPVLLVTGDTDTEDRYSLQNLPQRDLVLPTGAGFEDADRRTCSSTPWPSRHAGHSPSSGPWCSSPALPERRDRVSASRRVGAGLPLWDSRHGRPPRTPSPPSRPPADPVVLARRGGAMLRSGLLMLAARLGAGLATRLNGQACSRRATRLGNLRLPGHSTLQTWPGMARDP